MGKFIDNSVVTIKPNAYYKMLLHVLRFGSKALNRNQFKEVMGMLIGHLEGEGDIKNVIIEDAIPVSHGASIEVHFSVEQLGAFGKIDQEISDTYFSKGWFTVGWYHSHPDLTPFFSSVDVRNQIFWQDSNPSGIGLVFDHVLLEQPGNLGFKAFRLDDPKKTNLEYHEVTTLVEPPDNKDYYLKLLELVNSIHRKEPAIFELDESKEFFGEVVIPEQEDLKSPSPELNSEVLITSLREGLRSYISLSLNPLINVLNEWSQEIVHKMYFNNSQMRSDLLNLKNSLTKGITELKSAFDYKLTNKLGQLTYYIFDELEVIEKNSNKIKDVVEKFRDEFNDSVIQLLTNELKPTIKNVSLKLEEFISKLDEIEKNQKNLLTELEENTNKLLEIPKILETSKSRIISSLQQNQDKVLQNYKKKLKTVEGSYKNIDNNIKKVYSDLKAAILVLEGTREPIIHKIEKLESEKKDLHSSVRDLRSELKDMKKGD